MNKIELIKRLIEIREDECGGGDYEKASQSLNEIKVTNLCNALVYVGRDLDEEELVIGELVIQILQRIFNNSGMSEIITDELYEKLYAKVKIQTGEDIVGAPVDNVHGLVAHKYTKLSGTLSKVHFIDNTEKPEKENRDSLHDWEKQKARQLGRELPKDVIYRLSLKHDGVSGNISCNSDGQAESILLRGDTTNNETTDKLSLFKPLNIDFLKLIIQNTTTFEGEDSVIKILKEIEEYKEFGLKVEFTMTTQNYEKLLDMGFDYKNRRAAVTGLINADDTKPELISLIDINLLRMQVGDMEILLENRDEIYPKINRSERDMLKATIKVMEDMAINQGKPADGVVITIIDHNLVEELGRTKAVNNYEVAYKFPPEEKKTTILDVEFSIGTMGNITPVAKVKKVKMKGNTIKSINLGSIDRFRELGLRPGDEVILKYDVIPYLYTDDTCEISDEDKFSIPRVCPVCGVELIEDPLLKCGNNECKSRRIGKILNYVNKMCILDISEASITDLINNNIISDISDLYSLGLYRDRITSLNRWGELKLDNIIKSINSRKVVKDYVLLGSIGIQDVGRRMFETVLDKYTIEELLLLCCNNDIDLYAEELLSIKGIKEKTATKITQGIRSNVDLITELLKILTVTRDVKVNYDKHVCFSKVRDKEFEKFLSDMKIESWDKVNKETSLLVVDDVNSTSGKIDKAKKLNIPIVDLKQAHKIFKYKEV